MDKQIVCDTILSAIHNTTANSDYSGKLYVIRFCQLFTTFEDLCSVDFSLYVIRFCQLFTTAHEDWRARHPIVCDTILSAIHNKLVKPSPHRALYVIRFCQLFTTWQLSCSIRYTLCVIRFCQLFTTCRGRYF